MIDNGNIACFLEHTLLKPESAAWDIERLCAEARDHSFLGVCVNGCWASLARQLVQGSGVEVVAVVGFPLGAMSTKAKTLETECVVADGAGEVDFVINIGRLKQGDHAYVRSEIAEVVKAAGGSPVKVILETCLLNTEQKILACRLAIDAGAAFVKTSTGFNSGGATVADVKLMKETVGSGCGVKASGGIRDLATAISMIEAGATRLGTSASIAIIKGDK